MKMKMFAVTRALAYGTLDCELDVSNGKLMFLFLLRRKLHRKWMGRMYLWRPAKAVWSLTRARNWHMFLSSRQLSLIASDLNWALTCEMLSGIFACK